MAGAGALLLWEGRDLTFFSDEWAYLLNRRTLDPSVLFEPHIGHPIVVPLLIYNALVETFGADTYVPYRIVTVALVLLCGALFWLLARRRIGPAPALVPAGLLLFFGAGAEVTLTPTGIPTLCSIAAGLGALLALDRRDARGDLWAFLLLTVSLFSFSVGIAFAIGVAVEILRRPQREGWQAWGTFVVPLSLYAVWGAWSLQFDATHVKPENVGSLFSSIADSFAAVAAALTGLLRLPGDAGYQIRTDWGPPLATLVAVAVALGMRRSESRTPRLWAAIAITLTFWASVAMVVDPPGRTPIDARYYFPSAVFLLLVLVELGRGVRVAGWVRAAIGGALALSLFAQLAQLHDFGHFLRVTSDIDRAELAAIELSRDSVDQEFRPEGGGTPVEGKYLQFLRAGPYLKLVDDAGSPAYSLTELGAASERAREAADIVLTRALDLRLRPARSRPGRSCETFSPDGKISRVVLDLPPRGVKIAAAPGRPVGVELGRFADNFPFALDPLEGGTTATLSIPPDRASLSWHAELTTRGQQIRVCPLR